MILSEILIIKLTLWRREVTHSVQSFVHNTQTIATINYEKYLFKMFCDSEAFASESQNI